MRPCYFVIATLCLGLLLACAAPRATWLPAASAPHTEIHVYRTALHTIIALPATDATTTRTSEWAFGQKLWFYDARTSSTSRVGHALKGAWLRCGAVFQSGLWPSYGIIEEVHPTAPLPQREPALVRGQWTFIVTPAQVEAARTWLQAQRMPAADALYADAETTYYPASRRYWTFYTCHHFAATALREAGIPTGSFRCWLPWPFWHQLTKLEHAQERPQTQ